jgi:DNA-binding winged helix-turn-helix (wHTH) protein
MARHDELVVFGPFEANTTTGELRRNGVPVRIQNQPFQLLVTLLRSPGELVTQQELRRQLWPDGTHVAFERGLASAMRKLREALDDNARKPAYIETLPRRGYRFIAPVSRAVPAAAEPPAPPARPERPSARRMRLRWAAAVILTVVTGGQGMFPEGADDRLQAAESLSAYACLLKSQGDAARALDVIRQAHALAPESAKITAEVGFYLHAAGHYEAEFPMLRRALELDASSRDAWFHLGLAYARRQDFAKAVESLQRAKQIAGDDSSVDYWLAWAQERRRSLVSS